MLCTSPPQALALLLGVAAVLVGECPSAALPATINAIPANDLQSLTNDFSASELTLSMVINQMTLLRILNESSTIYSLRESDLANLRDLKLQLNATHEVLQDLRDMKEAAIKESDARQEAAKEELRGLKDEALNEVETRKREAEQQLQEDKEAALNELDTAKKAAITQIKALVKCEQSYRVYNGTLTQSEALTACNEHGGHLAVPMNDAEHEEIFQLVKDNDSRHQNYWIGIDDKQEEGKWISSVTGQPLNYTNFDRARGEPNNDKNGEDCVEIKKLFYRRLE